MELSLPKPFLCTVPRIPDRVYCEACEKSVDKKNWKGRLKKVVKEVFKSKAEAWAGRIHQLNVVYSRVDWLNDDYFLCNSCHSTFYHENHMQTFPQIESLKSESPQETETSPLLPSVDESASSSSTNPTPLLRRSSSRKRLSSDTNKDVDENGKKKKENACIICNSVKKDDKGRIIQPTIITLRRDDGDHLAEETLLRFARIHQQHDTCFKEAAERILLEHTIKSLFLSDVCYHLDQCYTPFRHKKFEKLEKSTDVVSMKPQPVQHPVDSLFELIRLHVIVRREVYLLSDIHAAYKELKSETCPALRVTDLRTKLLAEFPNEILIEKSSLSSYKNEYVFPASSRTIIPLWGHLNALNALNALYYLGA